jgi:GNAT superfamily N-acetyltransferase
MAERFSVKPLTPAIWKDFEDLFGARGACGGCWCMWWHLSRAEWTSNKGAGNRRRMRAKVNRGEIPGLIGYLDGRPAAWCSVMPRDAYAALKRSRMLKTVDDTPAFSIPCFFVKKEYRRRGLTVKLLRAAAQHVRSLGGTLLEGYPVIARAGKMPDAFAWTGALPAFERAGFGVCAKPSASRAVVRLKLG